MFISKNIYIVKNDSLILYRNKKNLILFEYQENNKLRGMGLYSNFYCSRYLFLCWFWEEINFSFCQVGIGLLKVYYLVIENNKNSDTW